MIRFVLISVVCASGCASSKVHRSQPGCWWQHARFDSSAPLFDATNEIELGTVRSGVNIPRLEGTLRTEGNHVLLEGTLQGERLTLFTSIDASKHPVLHVADRARVSSAGMVLEGTPMLALGLETGRILLGAPAEATAHFTPRGAAALVARCESLTLVEGESTTTSNITRAGFTGGAPQLLDASASLVLRDAPDGDWVGTFHDATPTVVPLESRDGWTRIAEDHRGVVWIGWVPTSTLTPAQTSERVDEKTAAEEHDDTKVIACSHTVKLMVTTRDGERAVGELSPGAQFSVGVSRNGRHLIIPRIPWFAPAAHFFTDDDVSNCSEVSAP